MGDESIEAASVSTDTVTATGWQWGGLDAYHIDSDGIVSTQAYRVNTDTGEYEQIELAEEDKVQFRDDRGVSVMYDYVGNAPARDWKEGKSVDAPIETFYAVWATPDGEKWGTTILSEGEE